MNKIIFLFLFCFIIGCYQKQSTINLNKNDIITNIFTDKEILQLESIVVFTDSLITSKNKDKDISSAYHDYFNFLATFDDNNEFLKKLEIDRPIYVKFVDSLKEKEIFDKIWIIEKGFGRDRQKIICEDLALNMNGKYLLFLKKYSKVNTDFRYYYEANSEIGDFAPSASMKFIAEHKKNDFNDPIIRLIASIHLISIKYRKDY